jgi:ribonucleotide reductase alpha subunit
MNNVIDYNFYPVKETEISNMSHRPIAIGVQGLANTFFAMKIPFESKEAKELNKKIFETIQYACLYESKELSKREGAYSTFQGSPASEGILQHNLWGINDEDLSGMWDWKKLKEEIKTYGLRNSMLTSCPPTASTSQILGNIESFEPMTSNLYMRSVLSGDYPQINKYMVDDLKKIGLWTDEIRDTIIINGGSIQAINVIPENIKKLYKTVWEIPQKTLMELSADRGAFIDQSQSLNLFFDKATPNKLNAAHFNGWKLGLKTSMYYCRTKPTTTAQKFTVNNKNKEQAKQEEILACSLENPGNCMACSG